MSKILAGYITATNLSGLGSVNYATYTGSEMEPQGWVTTGYDTVLKTPFATSLGANVYVGIGIPGNDNKFLFVNVSGTDVAMDEVFTQESNNATTQLTVSAFVDNGLLSDVNAGEVAIYLIGEFQTPYKQSASSGTLAFYIPQQTMVHSIYLNLSANETMQIGTTSTGSDILPSTSFTYTDTAQCTVVLNIIMLSDTTIYIQGPANSYSANVYLIQ